MDVLHRKIKYPNARYYYEDKNLKDDSANGIMKCIERFHAMIGGVAERVHTKGGMVDNRKTYTTATGFKQKVGSVEWRKTTGRKGTADMSIMYNGLSVKCEVKFGSDRQSDDQKKYEQDITSAGGIYIVVKSFEDYLIWFSKKHGRPKLMQEAICEMKEK